MANIKSEDFEKAKVRKLVAIENAIYTYKFSILVHCTSLVFQLFR